ncbi:hypothetical protein NUITMVS1_20830 [Shewanella xiamenensis]|nr:hypothetical protein NUITMVS1_20830 [Shewanella xiamenensis]
MLAKTPFLALHFDKKLQDGKHFADVTQGPSLKASLASLVRRELPLAVLPLSEVEQARAQPD